MTGASARKVYDRAFSLVPRRCVRAGAWSGASAREVYDRADLLVPKRCVRAGAASGLSSNSSLLVALAFFLNLLFLGASSPFSSDSNSKSLLAKYDTIFLADLLGSFLVEDTTLLESMQPSISIVTSSLVGSTVVAVRRYKDVAARWRDCCVWAMRNDNVAQWLLRESGRRYLKFEMTFS